MSVKNSTEMLMRIRKDMKGMNCLGERLVNHIDSPEDYQSKLDVIEKLTDGQALTPVESNLLDILCDTVELYENRAPQLSAFNARIEGLSEVDLIKALMLQNKLTGADLPEIGDKSVVSRILNGERKLTVEMVARLATRFHLSPGAVIH